MRKISIILICFCINSIQCSNRNGNVPQIIKILEKEFDHTFIRELKEMPENIVPDVFFSYFLYQFQEKIEGNNIKYCFQKNQVLSQIPTTLIQPVIPRGRLEAKRFKKDCQSHAAVVGNRTSA
jgi:hypothetical protein